MEAKLAEIEKQKSAASGEELAKKEMEFNEQRDWFKSSLSESTVALDQAKKDLESTSTKHTELESQLEQERSKQSQLESQLALKNAELQRS